MVSSRWRSSWLALLLLTACGEPEPVAPAPRPEPRPTKVTAQPAQPTVESASAPPDSATQTQSSPPFELAPLVTTPRKPESPKIELQLRSTPSGAEVRIDGIAIGATPVLWKGKPSDSAREFSFALPGYRTARYRFIPTRSGIVHGTLVAEVFGPTDAGAVSEANEKNDTD